MRRGIVGQFVLAVALIIALPTVLDAQESGQIRVSVRIVRSVIPDMQAATDERLSQLAQTGVSNKSFTKDSFQTERGYAQITTERLSPTSDTFGDQVHAAAETAMRSDPPRVLMTVAFTAN